MGGIDKMKNAYYAVRGESGSFRSWSKDIILACQYAKELSENLPKEKFFVTEERVLYTYQEGERV
jgi:hypothetical protein